MTDFTATTSDKFVPKAYIDTKAPLLNPSITNLTTDGFINSSSIFIIDVDFNANTYPSGTFIYTGSSNSTPHTITLPTAPNTGHTYTIYNAGSQTWKIYGNRFEGPYIANVTVSGIGHTIDIASLSIITLIYQGTNCWIATGGSSYVLAPLNNPVFTGTPIAPSINWIQ